MIIINNNSSYLPDVISGLMLSTGEKKFAENAQKFTLERKVVKVHP